MAEQLGIVYTPVEIVDFIIHSVNDVLKEFHRSISDENIHILPFTGYWDIYYTLTTKRSN